MSKGKKRSGARPGRPQPLRGTKGKRKGARDRKSGSAGMPRPSSYAVFCLTTPLPPRATLFPYTTLFRSCSRLPCVYAQETLTFLLTQKKTCVKNYVQKE